MEPSPDKDLQPAPTPYGDDMGSGDSVSPDSIPEAVKTPHQPWLLQDWIALTVAVVLTILFIGTTWTTLRDWPVVMGQIKSAKDGIANIKEAVEDPAALKRRLEETIRKADEDISRLRETISKLEQQRIEEAARKANLERENGAKNEELASARGILRRAVDAAKSELREKHPDLDFDELLENKAGNEPDPSGPNLLYSEWRTWKARDTAYKLIQAELEKPFAALKAAETKFQEVETALARAEFAFEKARESIVKHTDKLHRITTERDTAMELLRSSLVEPDEGVIGEIQKLQRQLRESESTKAALWFQNLPTVLALFLVSTSAIVRLALLRGHFKPRTLIPH